MAAIRGLAKGETSAEQAAGLDALRARLVDADGPYPQPMIVAQLRYLASMLDRADQRPGQDAVERLQELRGLVAECDAELKALRRSGVIR